MVWNNHAWPKTMTPFSNWYNQFAFLHISRKTIYINNTFRYVEAHAIRTHTHLKTASIAIDAKILTYIIAYKLNTCALHWYREILMVFLFWFGFLSRFDFVLAHVYFILVVVCFYYFISSIPFHPKCTGMWVYFSVLLGLIARDAAFYIRHLHSHFDTSNVVFFHAICFVRSCFAFVCFIFCFLFYALRSNRLFFIAH